MNFMDRCSSKSMENIIDDHPAGDEYFDEPEEIELSKTIDRKLMDVEWMDGDSQSIEYDTFDVTDTELHLYTYEADDFTVNMDYGTPRLQSRDLCYVTPDISIPLSNVRDYVEKAAVVGTHEVTATFLLVTKHYTRHSLWNTSRSIYQEDIQIEWVGDGDD